MVSGISGFSPYQATSGIYNTQKITSPQEDLRELSSIASSYYSVSDTIQPLKTATESDSRWLYRAVSNELGMPTGLEIDGMTETPAKITVNLSGMDFFPNPTQTNETALNQSEYYTQENIDELNSNAFEEILSEYASEYFAQNAEEALASVVQAIDLSEENEFGTKGKYGASNFAQKTAASAYEKINLNYINSYV